MRSTPRRRASSAFAATTAVALALFAACGDDDGTTVSPDAPGSSGSSSESTGSGAPSAPASGEPSPGPSLAGICPDPIVLQTDWYPEAEHGFVYHLIDPDRYSVDTGAVAVRGPLVRGGRDAGVTLEIRAGGPAVGFDSVTAQMYTDDDILLGFVYTDEAIQNSAEFPTVAIESGFEKNPLMIMWDPETYPDVETIEDIGEQGILVRYLGGVAYMDYFTATGILSPDQVEGSYDGTPGLFVADEGRSAQQGFGSAEPYLYEHEVEGWMKPVRYAYIYDAGWTNYAQSIATRPENIETYRSCFEALVPMIQQASVDYLADPEGTNAMIVDAVEKFASGWVYGDGVAAYAVETMKDDELIGNGPDGVVGNFDLDRVADLIEKASPIYAAAGQPPRDGLTATDIVTNEFIDEAIGR